MQYRVEFYQLIDGTKPLSLLLEQLRQENRVLYFQILDGLKRLSRRDNHGRPLTDKVDSTDGLFELRVGGKDIARVFFFFRPHQQIVCTHGYVKKSMKLDPKEVRRAEQYKQDWEDRFPN